MPSAKTQAGNEVTIRPLGDRVLIRPTANEEVTKSGLYLPDTAKEKPQRGTVVAVGSGKVLDNGTRQPMDLTVGAEVIYSKYAGTEVKQGDEDLLVLRESDILAIIVQ
jgi:chaperonin GroES